MPKHLTKSDLSELSDLLKAGKRNAEVAEHFKVSVATVNNHRTRLKREGMNFPATRGKRAGKPVEKIKKSSDAIGKLIPKVKMEQYNFIINGVVVTVSGKAKNVHIGVDSMEVNF